MQPDPAPFTILPHIEAHRDDRLGRIAGRIHVLDPVDLVEELLEPGRHLPFHFPRRGSGHVHQHVGDWHHNLGVLLSRGDEQGNRPGNEADDDEQNGEIPFEKRLNQAGHPVVIGFLMSEVGLRIPDVGGRGSGVG